jgi:tRNA A37 threonylcarbamoyladenosine dehydratase
MVETALKEVIMVNEQHSRTALLLGEPAIDRLANARVAVFGVGGVGGYVAEALARAGVGALDLIDSDTVSVSNLNRQIIALHSTVGRLKVDVMAERIRDINPDCRVRALPLFYLPEMAGEFDFSAYDYIADAIDTVSAKLDLAVRAHEAGTPIIAAMGAGNKLDAAAFEVADIAKTSVCPLARVMRIELRKRGINHMKVVYSKEEPHTPTATQADGPRRQAPGSVSFVPGAAGLVMAGEIIKDLLKE